MRYSDRVFEERQNDRLGQIAARIARGEPAVIYAYQDGAQFYVYSDEAQEHRLRIESAPFPVRDYDREAAIKARAWFDEYGYFKGAQEVRWVS